MAIWPVTGKAVLADKKKEQELSVTGAVSFFVIVKTIYQQDRTIISKKT